MLRPSCSVHTYSVWDLVTPLRSFESASIAWRQVCRTVFRRSWRRRVWVGAWSPCSAAPMPDSGCLPHAGIATLDASSVNVVFRCAAGSSKASHRFGVGRCAIRSGISGTCRSCPASHSQTACTWYFCWCLMLSCPATTLRFRTCWSGLHGVSSRVTGGAVQSF